MSVVCAVSIVSYSQISVVWFSDALAGPELSRQVQEITLDRLTPKSSETNRSQEAEQSCSVVRLYRLKIVAKYIKN